MNITTPGLVFDMSDETYHADPIEGGSLSSSMARLLTEHVPAKARAIAEANRETSAMKLGTMAHRVNLGFQSPEDWSPDGLTVLTLDGRTKAGKEEKQAAIDAGLKPVTEAAYTTATALYHDLKGMHDAMAAHDSGSRLLTSGKSEVSAFWQDEETGVWCRARFDVLPDKRGGTAMVVPDYKTTIDASRRGFAKSVARYGYHQQADFYERAVRALGINKRPEMRFVAQETSAPYLVNVHRIDHEARETARVLNDRALRIYAHCKNSGEWPGYTHDPEPLALPSFYFYDHEEALSA